MISTIFFDFDGVIVESVDIKGEAFAELFKEFGNNVVEQVVRYHHQNGGVSRFDKFKYIYEHVLNQPLSEAHFNHLCDRYSELVFNKVVACPFVDGALSFLEKYYKRYRFYVISGTPQEELERVVRERGLMRFFHSVHGSPKNKIEWSKELINQYCLSPEKIVFIGDAMSDLEAAQAHGLNFVARVTPETDVFKAFPEVTRVTQFQEFEQYLLTHAK